MHRKSTRKLTIRNELTIDFGYCNSGKDTVTGNPFQCVKSEMLKRRERVALRRKPMQYQKLQASLQQKMKKKSFGTVQQRDELVMLQKCKNYFQLRRNNSHLCTPKHSQLDSPHRPMTSSVVLRNSALLQQLSQVMRECENEHKQQQQIKQNMHLFTFYCKMMDKRLEGIKNNIEKKERMI